MTSKAWSGSVCYIYGDMRDEMSLKNAIQKSWPDEIYNFAGQVFVPLSWDEPEATFDVNTGGLARILKIVEQMKRDTKVYQASSSEMFGNHEGACTDETEMRPKSPYGFSKFAAHRLAALYRDRGLFVVGGILFNHESPRRGLEFVTRKVTDAAARIKLGVGKELRLGNLDARRDWGFAGDYVDAMWRMLQQDEPGDYVVGTGQSCSVRDLCATAFSHVGLDYREFVKRDERFVRPAEVDLLVADPTKAKTQLGWTPAVDFRGLIRMMVDADLKRHRASV